MHSHAPDNYACPFCRFARGVESPNNALADIVYQDDELMAFVAPKTWPHNAGNVLIVPKAHHEHLYTMPEALLARVAILAKHMAIAMKTAYGCEGTSIRQHNEPAGNQDVWHYHLHVFPRWSGDQLYQRTDEARYVPAQERRTYAEKLRSVLGSRPWTQPSLEGVAVAALGPQDWQELRAIRLEALQCEPLAFSSSYDETLARPDDDWRQRLSNDDSVHLIARAQGQPVGMVGGYLGSDGDESVAIVFGMYVTQEHRGQGIGRALLRSLIDRLSAESRITTVRLWVSEPQQPARRLYASVGFRVVGRSPDPPGDDLIMEFRVR